LIAESFCSQYSGCYTHDYTYKKKKKVVDVTSVDEGEMSRTLYTYEKKLLVKKVIQPSEEFSDMMEAETLRFEYTFY